MSKRENVLYARLSPETYVWMMEQCMKYEIPVAKYMNRVLGYMMEHPKAIPMEKYVSKTELLLTEYVQRKAAKKRFPEFHKAKSKLEKIKRDNRNSPKSTGSNR